jgi:hypothetical protein
MLFAKKARQGKARQGKAQFMRPRNCKYLNLPHEKYFSKLPFRREKVWKQKAELADGPKGQPEGDPREGLF